MNKSIKIVFTMISVLFIMVISTLIFFLVFKSNYYANHSLNKRLFEDRNKSIRGNILDRDGNILAYSDKDDFHKRVYPYGEIFLHPIGYFDEIYGISGIEKTMDEYLREPKGVINKIITFFKGKGELVGSSVKLTLNSELQEYAYDILGNNKGSIVVSNPKTGEIYALVSKPSFDPNEIRTVWNSISNDEKAPLYNRALNGKYPPGSTFKVITAAASLENIVGIENRFFMDNGSLYFNDLESLSNQYEQVYGKIDLKNAFIYSSNVVFGKLALELKNSILKQYSEKFYFNREIEMEGLNISKSYFEELDDELDKGLIAQSGIGQGSILSTPINMNLVANVIANDGLLNKFYIIDEIRDSYNNILNKNKLERDGRVIDENTSNKIKEYMKGVVDNNLIHIEEFQNINAAGKTGTADYKVNGIDGIPHSWFIGFAPYENPLISISVIVEEGGEGSKIASSIAAKVLKKGIDVLN